MMFATQTLSMDDDAIAPQLIIAAAGTGGHVFPGISVAQAAEKEGWQVHWIGTTHGREQQWVNEAQMPFFAIDFQGLRGNGWHGYVTLPWRLIQAIWQAVMILRRLTVPGQANAVLVMGGYVSVPVGLAAKWCRMPLYLHEQNSVSGSANRVLLPLVRQAFTGLPQVNWKGWDRLFAQRIHYVGNPIRQDIQRKHVPGTQYPCHLLILGGSLGARALNQHMPSIVMQLCRLWPQDRAPLKVLHQTGQADWASTRHLYDELSAQPLISAAQIQVVPFIDDMAHTYAWADVMLARAGALTVSEIWHVAMPTFFIPFPYAIDNHQQHNAHILVDMGGAQSQVQADWLTQLETESGLRTWVMQFYQQFFEVDAWQDKHLSLKHAPHHQAAQTLLQHIVDSA